MPTRPVNLLFRAPAHLYRWHLGWLLGRRFLVVTYRGRHTGRTVQTVLEVVHHDPAARESVVVSAFGRTAGWFASIRSTPALTVQTGRLDYAPAHRELSPEERRQVAGLFVREHPLEARLAPRVLAAIGAAEPDRAAMPAELLASLPMVAFRPREGAPPNSRPPG